MNERNVDALCRIYCAAALKQGFSWEEINDDLQTHMQLRDSVRRVCREMAAVGVLVPSALTDEEVTDFPFDGAFMATGKDGELVAPATERRTALERIAKGESA